MSEKDPKMYSRPMTEKALTQILECSYFILKILLANEEWEGAS